MTCRLLLSPSYEDNTLFVCPGFLSLFPFISYFYENSDDAIIGWLGRAVRWGLDPDPVSSLYPWDCHWQPGLEMVLSRVVREWRYEMCMAGKNIVIVTAMELMAYRYTLQTCCLLSTALAWPSYQGMYQKTLQTPEIHLPFKLVLINLFYNQSQLGRKHGMLTQRFGNTLLVGRVIQVSSLVLVIEFVYKGREDAALAGCPFSMCPFKLTVMKSNPEKRKVSPHQTWPVPRSPRYNS